MDLPPHRPLWPAVALVVGLASVLTPAAARAYDFEITARTEGHGYQLRRYDRG